MNFHMFGDILESVCSSLWVESTTVLKNQPLGKREILWDAAWFQPKVEY